VGKFIKENRSGARFTKDLKIILRLSFYNKLTIMIIYLGINIDKLRTELMIILRSQPLLSYANNSKNMN